MEPGIGRDAHGCGCFAAAISRCGPAALCYYGAAKYGAVGAHDRFRRQQMGAAPQTTAERIGVLLGRSARRLCCVSQGRCANTLCRVDSGSGPLHGFLPGGTSPDPAGKASGSPMGANHPELQHFPLRSAAAGTGKMRQSRISRNCAAVGTHAVFRCLHILGNRQGPA